MGLRRKIGEGRTWLASRGRDRGAVLLYHRVDEIASDPFRLGVSPVHFAEQMEVLARRGGARAHDDFLAEMEAGRLRPGSVLVTFDDGYRDVFEQALPILERFEIPATVFVTTGHLGSAFWWDRLSAILEGAEIPASIELDEEAGSIPFALPEGEPMGAYDRIYQALRRIGPERRDRIIDSVARRLGRAEHPEGISRAATVEELRRAAEHPLITLQAHTVTHSRLSALSGSEQLEEIRVSARRLEQITGETVASVSYPFGLRGRDYDETTRGAVEEAGLRFGFAADRGVVDARTNRLDIPRLWVHDRPGRSFRRQLDFWLGRAGGVGGTEESAALPAGIPG